MGGVDDRQTSRDAGIPASWSEFYAATGIPAHEGTSSADSRTLREPRLGNDRHPSDWSVERRTPS